MGKHSNAEEGTGALRRLAAGFGILATLLACGGGSTSHVTAPDGKPALKVKCKGDRADCLEMAGVSCGTSGYHILSEDAHSGGLAADLLPGPVPWWTMVVKCGKAPAEHVAPAPKAPVTTVLPAPPVYSTTPRTPTPASSGCASDFECPHGQHCTKDSYALRGICAQPVNEYGNPTHSPPRLNSVGAGDGSCSHDAECAPGFRCVRTSGGLRGNCMR